LIIASASGWGSLRRYGSVNDPPKFDQRLRIDPGLRDNGHTCGVRISHPRGQERQ
jgi:hypothetical protein